jgi:hypothetical protein
VELLAGQTQLAFVVALTIGRRLVSRKSLGRSARL